MKSPTSITNNSYVKINPELLIDPVIAFFYQIGELTNYLTENKNLDFQTFKNIIIFKVGPNIKKVKNPQQIFDMILTGIEQNSKANKEYNDQSLQYDEAKGLNKFMEKHKKGNIIQKLFLIPKEEKVSCKKCGMNTYQFNYAKYIFIKNPQTDLIYQKLFFPNSEHRLKSNFCQFCNGQETEATIITKVLDYPENLIVIIEPTQVNNFNIGLNSVATNGVNLSYLLNQFIEANTNILYQINPNNTLSCHLFNKNINENISNKKPIVLFYKLIKINTSVNKNTQLDKNNQIEKPLMQQNFNNQNNFQNNFNDNNMNNNNNNNFQNNNFNMNFQNNNFPIQFNNINNNMNQNLNMNFNNNNNNQFNNFGMDNNGNNMNMQNQNDFINNNNFNNNMMNNNNMMMNNNNFNNNMMMNNMNIINSIYFWNFLYINYYY